MIAVVDLVHYFARIEVKATADPLKKGLQGRDVGYLAPLSGLAGEC